MFSNRFGVYFLYQSLRLQSNQGSYSQVNLGSFLLSIYVSSVSLWFIFQNRAGTKSLRFHIFFKSLLKLCDSLIQGSSMHPPRKGNFPTKATIGQGATTFVKNTSQAGIHQHISVLNLMPRSNKISYKNLVLIVLLCTFKIQYFFATLILFALCLQIMQMGEEPAILTQRGRST